MPILVSSGAARPRDASSARVGPARPLASTTRSHDSCSPPPGRAPEGVTAASGRAGAPQPAPPRKGAAGPPRRGDPAHAGANHDRTPTAVTHSQAPDSSSERYGSALGGSSVDI